MIYEVRKYNRPLVKIDYLENSFTKLQKVSLYISFLLKTNHGLTGVQHKDKSWTTIKNARSGLHTLQNGIGAILEWIIIS